MKKILITGASGYIGARLCRHLADAGHRVIAHCFPDIPKDKSWLDRMHDVVGGDFRDERTLHILAERDCDIVVHLVSLDQIKSEGEPDAVASINVMPTWKLLHLFSRKGLDAFLYLSTFQVYGKVPNTLITEDIRPAPRNIYGLTHWMSEALVDVFRARFGFPGLNLRLSNSYGSPVFPGNECWSLVINDLCRSAFLKKEIRLRSDGSPLRDFVHGSDVCRAMETLIGSAPATLPQSAFHVSSGTTLTIMESACRVQALYRERYGREVPIYLPDGAPAREFGRFRGIDRYVVDNSKLKALGFEPRMSLDDGIRELFAYLESAHDALN